MRQIAIDILMKYKQENSYLNIELNHVLNKHELSKEDKDLITRIVYGTVQNEIYLDYQLASYIKTKIKKYDHMVLLMSLYQLIFLTKIPDYAIINEAVNLVKHKGGKYRSQVVNAILRNFLRQGCIDIEGTEEEKLSISTSTPLWLVKMLIKQLGKETTQKVLASYHEVPTLAARVNTLKTSRNEILKNYDVQVGYLSQDAILFKSGNIANTDLFKQGLVSVQDESSQMVALLLNPAKHSRVLDMCSAPGSKTTHLSAIMENTGMIEAIDLYEHKIQLIQNNAKRLNATNIHAQAYDSTKLTDLFEKESFDSVLLDGPCSGLGVIRRKPEIKYLPSTNMDEIIVLQRKLLENAYLLLKKGGHLVYSTCTINKKENQLQVIDFIKHHQDMKVVEERLVLPFEYHSDGFYMCKMKKE